LFLVSFAVWKLLTLIKGHLFVFVFIFITPGGESQTILLKQKNIAAFIESGFTFRSLIHFEFIFCMVL